MKYMYHPGKILEIFKPNDKDGVSADKTTQVTCEMWDENILTFLVAKKLENKLKIGQYVLVSYRPMPGLNPPVPEHLVVKIISKTKGEKIWQNYKDNYLAKKRRAQNEQSYIA
ncbi:MAG: hypothetical protein NC918_00185 [Candidatus Omnitrophica bacterium]|nr:hypothetical protein [Candidatus Omnitrophota bacterium]